MKERRNTIQKGLILDAVFQMKNHPNAEMIYEYISKTYNNISRATVYRNLNQMAESGEILKVEMANAPSIFDFNIEKHHHLFCRNCGRIFDFESDKINQIEDILKQNKIVRVEGLDIVVKGICTECTSNELKQRTKTI